MNWTLGLLILMMSSHGKSWSLLIFFFSSCFFGVLSMVEFQSTGGEVNSWQTSHLVSNSWLPLFMSGATFCVMLSALFLFKWGSKQIFFTLLLVLGIFYFWMRDVSRESAFQGVHSSLVQSGLKWGLFWFLFSETWFFFSVFWSFFHVSLSPITSSSFDWPLSGIDIIPPFQVPLLNTVILLMSGLTATLGHHELLSGKKTDWIFYSVLLGVYFLALQGMEYYSATFGISSSVYGSVFFFGTGFHGLHVCLGVVMLTFGSLRIKQELVTAHHHFGLEFGLWYWHFVDVVWLFLFFWVYTWGAGF